MDEYEPAFPPAAHRRWKALLVLSAAAFAVHLVALSGLQWSWLQPDAAPLPTVMQVTLQVRTVTDALTDPVAAALQAAPPVVLAEADRPVVKATVVRPKIQRAAPVRAPAPARALSPALPAPSAVRVRLEVTDEEPPMQLALATAAPVNTGPSVTAPASAEENIPHYPTRIPPASTFKYRIQRGLLSGAADLEWRPTKDHYELRFESKVAGLTILTQVSQGGFDHAGLAPVRFTDQRLRRAVAAANFQRAAGKITFSGPSTEFALRPGSQDRLSWMVQLAAIVSADPALRKPGARIVMNVAGANGDLAVWSFRCNGPESIESAGGTVEALSYVREPQDPHDTRAEVWLDPGHHYLPAHATLKSGPNDDGLELRLQEVVVTAAP